MKWDGGESWTVVDSDNSWRIMVVVVGGSSEMVEDVGVAAQLRVAAVHLWSSLLLLI